VLALSRTPERFVVAGDWDGDRRDGIVVFRGGHWTFDLDFNGFRDRAGLREGVPGDLPVAGDWDGDGRDGIGIVRQGVWHIDEDANGLSDRAVVHHPSYGDAFPITGDWDGDRRDGVGFVW
jgi:hypothetical protein